VKNRLGRPRPLRRAGAGGFTVIELMIAMLLGLIVVGSMLGVTLMLLQTSRTNAALSQVQSGVRLAFELMAHDIRNAGLTGCGNSNDRVTNLLMQQLTQQTWWSNWNDYAFVGHAGSQTDPAVSFGTATANRVSGTDSITVLGAADTAMSVSAHDAANSTFTVSGDIGNLQAGDVLIVCDPYQAAIFRIATVSGTDLTYRGGTLDTFNLNSQIAPLSAANWYVGISKANDGTWSLYRQTPNNTQEMVRGVTAMNLSYLQAGQFMAADGKTADNKDIDWTKVTAVQVSLTLQNTSQRAGTGAQPLKRPYTTTIALYNRLN